MRNRTAIWLTILGLSTVALLATLPEGVASPAADPFLLYATGECEDRAADKSIPGCSAHTGYNCTFAQCYVENSLLDVPCAEP